MVHCTPLRTRAHTRTHTSTYAHTNTHANAHTHTYANAHTHAYTHVCAHAYARSLPLPLSTSQPFGRTVRLPAQVGKPERLRAHFDTMLHAFITVFIIISCDNWTDIMFPMMSVSGRALAPPGLRYWGGTGAVTFVCMIVPAHVCLGVCLPRVCARACSQGSGTGDAL